MREEPDRFLRWATPLPSRKEIVLRFSGPSFNRDGDDHGSKRRTHFDSRWLQGVEDRMKGECLHCLVSIFEQGDQLVRNQSKAREMKH